MTVEIVDFPFKMTSPDFGGEIENIDGTVLYLNDLITSADNSVVLRNFSEDDLVHLVAPDAVTESGIVGGNIPAASGEAIDGYFYYAFPDDLKIYSEHALVVLVDA